MIVGYTRGGILRLVKAVSWVLAFGFLALALPLLAFALEVQWSGQFRTEFNWIHNYSLDSSDAGAFSDPARAGRGYYIPGGGSRDSRFETIFLRLRPKIVVNDNIYIKSEWWVGDPVYGLFGDSVAQPQDRRYYNSTFSGGSLITAQRFWGEYLTDIGTLQLGRAPLHWGLGVVWNSGEGIWDRYMSTGDVARLVSKFGAFSLTPALVVYSQGTNIGGACRFVSSAVGCVASPGRGGVVDYSLQFKYDNLEEDMEGGVNFIKRLAGYGRDTDSGFNLNGPASAPGMNFNTWDIYAKKKLGSFTFGAEVPIVTGQIGGVDYRTFALATEADWKPSDRWDLTARFGRAAGQTNTGGPTLDQYRAFYFHPNYKLGMLMFNYQFANFAGPNTANETNVSAGDLRSPYDNPIVNATYLALGGAFRADKWKFRAGFAWARAIETARVGQNYFNHWTRTLSGAGANTDQGNSLGWEMDYGADFAWDENFLLGLDLGFFFPGSFYKFSDVAGLENSTSMVWGTAARVGVTF